MKLLFAALLLAPTSAARAADNTSAILAAVDEGIKAEARAETAAESKKRSADDETRLIYWDAQRNAQRKMIAAYDRAIKLTLDSYGLSSSPPPNPRAAPPSTPEGAWAAGMSAPRSTIFLDGEYRAVLGSDGAPHYLSDDPAQAANGAAYAVTDPDGRSTVFPRAMLAVSEEREPGILALTLHHEELH